MRTALWGIVVAGGSLAGALALYTGCGALPDDCRERFNCAPGIGGSSSGTLTSASTSTSAGTGGDSGPPAQCVPTAGQDAVADTCGLFVSVSLGDDTKVGVGSKSKPYKTLAAAVVAASATKARIYACAETFTETVTVTAGVGIYGGLDCANGWTYTDGARSTLTTEADAVPLTLSDQAAGVELFDFKVQAVNALLAGGSSIAVIANQVTASLTRCDLIAGNGKDGLVGATATGTWPGATNSQIRGNDGANACTDAIKVSGGPPKENVLCMLAANPVGGGGGDGFPTSGNTGAASPMNAQTALGGKGQTALDPTWDCVTGAGHNGVKGTPGSDGAGAKALGTIAVSGYSGVAGGDAGSGQPGQGGGGGGGSKGKSGCAGASGASGGAGGCGGQGGTGGKAGGASIALVSLGATLSFNKVTVMLGAGGAGGGGGEAQGGGPGGVSGLAGAASGAGTVAACRGGDGGAGGDGGKGGGGHGGHAIGIAASGDTPLDAKGVMFSQKGTAGLGGKGGSLQDDGNPGVLAPVQVFP